MSEKLKQVTGRILKKQSFIGTCVVFKKNNIAYAITAGHNLYGQNLDIIPDINEYEIELENKIKLKIDEIITDEDFSKKNDTSLLIISNKNIENIEIKDLIFASTPDDRHFNFTLRSYISINNKYVNFRDIKFDELFIEEDIEIDEIGATNIKKKNSKFYVDINKSYLINNRGDNGSEWMSGTSGSGLFYENASNLTCLGIFLEIPDLADSGKLLFASISPIKDIFEELNFIDFKNIKSQYLTKKDIESDKKNLFIQNNIKIDNLINRNFENSINIDQVYFENSKLSLIDIIGKNERIVILGNPGIGKSTELIQLSVDLWGNDAIDFIPIFRNLRNFTLNDSIEKYINFDQIKYFDRLIFILDGLDELVDSHDFISKLERFISTSEIENRIFKFVISCRTNIFENLSLTIEGFESYYLKELNFYQGIELFEKLSDIKIDKNELNYNNLIIDFLKNPFQIKILTSYYIENQKFPNNNADLWKTYINNRLQHDKHDKLKKISLNTPLIKDNSMKVSLLNELMKLNTIKDDNLYSTLKKSKSDYDEFLKNPLLDKILNEENWKFEHRSIQEYFSASALISKDFETIIELITIKTASKSHIHPNFHNVIVLMINLLGQNCDIYEKLIEWIKINAPEILFKADSDRISTYQVDVFQDYFKKQCIEKKLWIGTNNGLSESEIAKFGNCTKNFDFLFDIIKDEVSHFRVKISALHLLSDFTLPTSEKEKVKSDLFAILNNKKVDKKFKLQIIRCFISFKLHTNKDVIIKILEIFKKETNKEINGSLLALIRDEEDIDTWFDYIKKVFLREFKITKTPGYDDAFSGNRYVLQELILKLENSTHFIEFASYYCDDYNLRYNEDYSTKLITRFLYFSDKEPNLILELLKIINKRNKHRNRHNEEFLQKIIVNSNQQNSAFKFLLKNKDFSEIKWFLGKIANETTIELIIEKYCKKQFEDNEFYLFRNILYHANYDLAEIYNSKMLEMGFLFKDLLPTKEEILENTVKLKTKIQDNFNILFSKKDLLIKIEQLFTKHSLTEISPEDVSLIESEFWDVERNWANALDVEIEIIHTLVYKKGILKFEELANILEDDSFLFKYIKKVIERNDRSKNDFEILPKQIDLIKNWCSIHSKNIDFEDLIIYNGSNSFFYNNIERKENHELLKAVLFFVEMMDVEMDNDFLLNSIETFELEISDDSNEKFNLFLNRINNKKLVNLKITENLQKQLFSFSFQKHARFALENKLEESYVAIKEHFTNDNNIYSGNKLFDLYFKTVPDVDFLQQFCKDMISHSSWTCLKLILKTNHYNVFCLSKSKEYLANSQHNEFNQNAIRILFELDDEDALGFYIQFFEEYLIRSIDYNYYSNYSKLKGNDFQVINKLFQLIYSLKSDSFEFSNHNTFMNTYIFNLSKNEEKYKIIQEILIQIKNGLKQKEDTKIFYINLLIETSTKSFINEMSKPLSFENALKKVNEIIN